MLIEYEIIDITIESAFAPQLGIAERYK